MSEPEREITEEQMADENAQWELVRLNEDADHAGVALPRVPYGMAVEMLRDAGLVVGALQDCDATEARIQAQADTMKNAVRRYRDWLWRQYEYPLKQLAASELQGKKQKSLKLLTGQGGDKPAKLGFRTVKGSLRIVNKEEAVQWADRDDTTVGFIKTLTEHKPIAAKFKEHFEQTGEIPDGCEVTEDEERFYVK